MTGRKALKNNKGQSLVETALVLPIILIILMGIIDFGMMFNNYIVIGNAAREGARGAATGASDNEVGGMVADAAGSLDIAKLSVTITPDPDLRVKGGEVCVTVEYDYNMITPIIAAIIPGPIHLTSTAVMQIE